MIVPPNLIPSLESVKSDIKSRPARWTAVLVVLLLAANALSISSWMKASAGIYANPVPASPQIASLVGKLRSGGGDPSVLPGGKIQRAPFSVPGILVSIHGDNIQMFEYARREAALEDAVEFLASQNQSYLRIEGSVIVLYTGKRKEVVSVLKKSIGDPGI